MTAERQAILFRRIRKDKSAKERKKEKLAKERKKEKEKAQGPMTSSSSNDDVLRLIAQLSVESPEHATVAARTIKNAIIANPTNKRLYLEHGVLPRLVTCTSKALAHPILAEHVVASLGSLAPYISPTDVPAVTNALVQCLFSTSVRTVYASARALKLLVSTPPVDISDIATIIVTPDITECILSLLNAPDEGVAEVCAVVISRTAECGDSHVQVYSEAGAVASLVDLMQRSTHERCVEACINALNSLARWSKDVSHALVVQYSVIRLLMPFTRTPVHSLRLSACRLLSTLHLSNLLPVGLGLDASVTTAVVNLLTGNSHHGLNVVAQTLTLMVSDSRSLQRVAMESGAIMKLANILLSNNSVNKSETEANKGSSSQMSRGIFDRDVTMHDGIVGHVTVDDEGNDMSVALCASALKAVAAITDKYDPARDSVISKGLLPVIVKGLTNENSTIVESSMSCIKSLSRSVKILRKKLTDKSIGIRVVSLLDTDNMKILRTATAALCNLVLEFSPVREVVLEKNGIKKIIDLLRSKDEEVRKNCVWVLNNLLFRADMETKNRVLSKLGYESLRALFSDDEPKVRALAMTVMRNLACSTSADTQNEQLDALFAVTGEELISMLIVVLSNDSSVHVELVIQALYVVCNIASGTEKHKSFLLESDIPQLILNWTCHPNDRVRIAAVWCTINLSWRDRVMPVARPSAMGIVPAPVPSSPPPRRHTRAMRRTLRAAGRRTIYEGRNRLQMLGRQHLPLPSSTAGRRILERYVGGTGNVNSIADVGRLGNISSDGNDDMWLVDGRNGRSQEMVDGDAPADIDGNHSESNQSEDSNGINNNNVVMRDNNDDNGNGGNITREQNETSNSNVNENAASNSNDDNNIENANRSNDNNEIEITNSNPSNDNNNGSGGQNATADNHLENSNSEQQNMNQNVTRIDDDSDLCPSGYEASGSGGVDGSAGEGDHSGSNSSLGKSCGYEWRIERLRQLGFEGRLRLLVNDPHIEVQGRARAALQLFDCTDVRPLEYSPSALLITGRTEPPPLPLSVDTRDNDGAMFAPPRSSS